MLARPFEKIREIFRCSSFLSTLASPSCHATFEFEIRGLFQSVTILPFFRFRERKEIKIQAEQWGKGNARWKGEGEGITQNDYYYYHQMKI